MFLTLLHCQDLYNCPKHCKDPVFDTVTWTRPLQLTKTLQKHYVFVTLTLTGALQLSTPLQKHNNFDPYADKTPYNYPKPCKNIVFDTLTLTGALQLSKPLPLGSKFPTRLAPKFLALAPKFLALFATVQNTAKT